MPSAFFVQVAVPSPLYPLFDYRVSAKYSEEKPKRGMRVKVPFGKRELVGIVWNCSTQSHFPEHQIKTVIAVLDETPLLSKILCELAEWAAHYYQHPLGEVLELLLPKSLREGKVVPDGVLAPSALRDGNPSPTKPKNFELNSDQQKAIHAFSAARDFQIFVLQGVTGSGKTEVYLQTIAATLARGEQALVLVPEIGLTPQTVERFATRFLVPVALFHSGLTDKERLHTWIQTANGTAKIVIGTRSAIFLSFQKLGQIIVDEEHDLSFKQQNGFRYSARDVAVRRAQLENIPIILGSATLSLSTLANVEKNRYQFFTLPERAGDAALPTLHLIDLRNQKLQGGLSTPLIAAVEKHLAKKQQILLFLNRRGYAPIWLCHHCGWRATCHRCDATLTLHHPNTHPKLHCHHCDAVKSVPKKCESCGNETMVAVGLGTEQLEQTVQHLFPNASIVRLDRDNTRKKGSLQNLLSDIQTGKADIILGTQMLAKGHHFPYLSLVAVVDADQGLFSADFRALEYLGQQLVQVAGRAGREKAAGEVLIQTHQPEHALLQTLLQEGYPAFSKKILIERKTANLPPFSYQAILRAEATQKTLVVHFLNEAKTILETKCSRKNHLEILGPLVLGMEKVAGRYRSELLLQSQDRKYLQTILSDVVRAWASLKSARKVRWAVDVDPI